MNSNKTDEYISLVNSYMKNELTPVFPEVGGVYDAMYYSVKNGGKRVRPLLCMLFCEAAGGNAETSVPLACAVEFIHTYSLIHDDLPCMDNDDFRRGKPSNHKVFGEANALLAGDGLLTAAFGIIADGAKKGKYPPEVAVEAVSALSHYAGASGMVGGQYIDLAGENEKLSAEKLELMEKLKTGCLISAACVMGCIAAKANNEKIEAAKTFATNIGLAFQIKDDILDVTGTAEKLGKPVGSDEENNKSTYVKIFGLEKCRELVEELTNIAMKSLDVFENNEQLKQYAEHLSKRDN